MAELILPGVFIEVRPEGLIVPTGVPVGNVGVVGTASKGPVGEPQVLGGYTEAVERFGRYDPWIDGASDELTLVRALEQVFRFGATTVIAVRVAGTGANAPAAATHTLQSPIGDCVLLAGKTPGAWGNGLSVNVAAAEEHAFVEDEEVTAAALGHAPVVRSARTRIRVLPGGAGAEQPLAVIYDDDPNPPAAGQVKVDRTTGDLTFGSAPEPGDTVLASYLADESQAVKVTLRFEGAEEVFTVVSGDDLIRDLADPVSGSAWVQGTAQPASAGLPDLTAPPGVFHQFAGGTNGAAGANYEDGLTALLEQPVQIVLGAGQDQGFGATLAAHCQLASSDSVKRDRIGLVGSSLGASLADLQQHNLSSDRLIFVAPGIRTVDAAANPPAPVTLSGAYSAAAVAGLLASFDPHVSPTNKVLSVAGLERVFTQAELKQLVTAQVLALEQRQGFRIVRGITTSSNTAWLQITTRRIVDYAKAGVRSAAQPFIGRLNNARVRGALRTAVNAFLAEMVTDEMLVSYELEVTATRDDERRGIARVNMVLRPTFSIEFIKVTMFLE
jgi:hypothetical protein